MAKEILIIDDSWTTLVLLEWFLKEQGFETIIVTDVEKAFEYLEKNKPALILLDLQMPNISGFDFLEKYQKDIAINSIPVLIISANDTTDNIDKVKELGAVEFVPKPFELKDLLKKINDNIR
jgi:DNA-binding response OmpR family regulator